MKTSVERIVVDDVDMYTGTRPKYIYIRDRKGRLMWRKLKKILESDVKVRVMPIELVDELIFDLARLEQELAWLRAVDDVRTAQDFSSVSFTNEIKRAFERNREEVEDDRMERETWILTMEHDADMLAVYARILIELRENEKQEIKKFFTR